MIAPIETVYKGYRFRSRLEARWAVFYDALGIEWLYEHEGYNLNGIPYLPDFYIPHLDCFIEIKGQAPTKEEEGKCALLSFLSEKKVFLFYGEIAIPHDGDNWYKTDSARLYWNAPSKREDYFSEESYLLGLESDKAILEGKGHCSDIHYLWCECPSCGVFGIEFDGRADRIACKCQKLGDKGYNYDSWQLYGAYLLARQARFEHGIAGGR